MHARVVLGVEKGVLFREVPSVQDVLSHTAHIELEIAVAGVFVWKNISRDAGCFEAGIRQWVLRSQRSMACAGAAPFCL